MLTIRDLSIGFGADVREVYNDFYDQEAFLFRFLPSMKKTYGIR